MNKLKQLKPDTEVVFKVTSHCFELTGYVIGNTWGGGHCSYRAEKVVGASMKEVLSQAQVLLESGALDSGMGYESLLGAYLVCNHTITLQSNDPVLGSDIIITCKGSYDEAVKRLFVKDINDQDAKVVKALMRSLDRRQKMVGDYED